MGERKRRDGKHCSLINARIWHHFSFSHYFTTQKLPKFPFTESIIQTCEQGKWYGGKITNYLQFNWKTEMMG